MKLHPLLFMLMTLLCAPAAASADEADRPPNVVIIFVDDMGWGDIGLQGAEGYQTPNLDRMANEGVRFTQFYVTQAVCSASRAGLLTGSYSNRVSIFGALTHRAEHGLNPEELNLAKLTKRRDYATAIYGKWHLGHREPFLPPNQGFDHFVGIPYSNDMWPHHPVNPTFWPDLPLIENTRIINPAVTGEDQAQFTRQFTEHAIAFIEAHRDEPFFVYVPHPMPHVPLFASDRFEGSTQRGLYGDVISEIDWSVGQILNTLDRLGLDDDTLVMFMSDNGPWLSYGSHGGDTAGLREGKGTSFEGGNRVPAIMRWPGKIPAGLVQDEMAMTIDILPTLAHLLDVDLSADPKIDGRNIWPLMTDADAESPHEVLFFFLGRNLEAVRDRRFKLHFPRQYRMTPEEYATGGQPNPDRRGEIGLELFDLVNDREETTNVADAHPEVVERLQREADRIRTELGDAATNTQGNEVRPPGRIGE